jgi:Zn-dependent protease
MNIFAGLISLIFFLIAVTIHELSHGLVADKLGDPTPRNMGRLTLNPFAHVDLIGTFIVPLGLLMLGSPIVFGWAKPVPVNFHNLFHPKRDMIWVSLAGPIANILLVVVLSLLLHLKILPEIVISGQPVILTGMFINLLLGLFNLIPVPPLDGSRILAGILSPEQAYKYNKLERYGFIILIFLLYIGIIEKVIYPILLLLIPLFYPQHLLSSYL